MIANATCYGSSVYIHHTEELQPESSIRLGEALILIPQPQPEIRFTVPICPWQGNGS